MIPRRFVRGVLLVVAGLLLVELAQLSLLGAIAVEIYNIYNY